jgi:hypothetical protein
MNRPANRKMALGVVIIAVILSIFACNLPARERSGEEGAPLTTEPSPTPSDQTGQSKDSPDLTGLSDQQKVLVEEFGWPHFFTLLESEDAEGRPVRYEVWTYYDGQTSYTFLDGIFQFDEPAESLPSNALATPYHPNQFILGASAEQAMAQVPGTKWAAMPGVETFQEGMQIYLSQQLMVGFYQDRLIYIDAMAFVPEEAMP